MPLTFSEPHPAAGESRRTDVDITFGRVRVGRLAYPHNWSEAVPKPPFCWEWLVVVGKLDEREQGVAETREAAASAVQATWERWLSKYGLQEGAGPPQTGSLALRRADGRSGEDYDVVHVASGSIFGRATYPDTPTDMWGWNLWLYPHTGRLRGHSETREQLLRDLRDGWNGWLSVMGLSERPG